jgi:hypothetical protein
MVGVEVGFWIGSERLHYNGDRSSFSGLCAFHTNACETASQTTPAQNKQAWQNRQQQASFPKALLLTIFPILMLLVAGSQHSGSIRVVSR